MNVSVMHQAFPLPSSRPLYTFMTKMTETESKVTPASEIISQPKKESFPPKGYICNLCSVPGHWIQQCPEKPKQRKRKKKTAHEYVAGVDPSPKDIQNAKQMQQLKPPKCDCGAPSRLKKVKRSKVMDSSRANGSYFFFCAKQRDDTTKCNFARPVEEELKTVNDKKCSNFFAKRRKSAGKNTCN